MCPRRSFVSRVINPCLRCRECREALLLSAAAGTGWKPVIRMSGARAVHYAKRTHRGIRRPGAQLPMGSWDGLKSPRIRRAQRAQNEPTVTRAAMPITVPAGSPLQSFATTTPMPGPLTKRFTLADLRAARASGTKVPMLTCYDFTTARLMQEAGVPMLLVGDSAANVILGHSSTLPIPLEFLIEITAAVRRGAPNALVMADMPFGSYASVEPAHWVENVLRMVKLSGCDCVKLEVTQGHAPLIKTLADAGVAVVAHLGL